MKNFFLYFLNPNHRKILLKLFMHPATINILTEKSNLSENEVMQILQELEREHLVDHKIHSSELIYRIKPEIREKVGKTFSRIFISVLFAMGANALRLADNHYNKRQVKRFRDHWHS